MVRCKQNVQSLLLAKGLYGKMNVDLKNNIVVRDITFSVCMMQFTETVKFIAEHNPYFKDKHVEISSRLKESIEDLANNPNGSELSTMGFTVRRCIEDDTHGTIEITVDPALASQLSCLMTMEFKGKIQA